MAARIAQGLVETAAAYGGRLPELFCGFDLHDLGVPVPYPTSCSPQAWAAATPTALVTALLGIDPERSHIDNHVPRDWGRVRISGLHLPRRRVAVDSDAREVRPWP